jgi:hypothetical protein
VQAVAFGGPGAADGVAIVELGALHELRDAVLERISEPFIALGIRKSGAYRAVPQEMVY